MIVTKDVEGYFNTKYSKFRKTLKECSVNDAGGTSITSLKEAYKFDDIAQQIMSDKPTSVDCIFFGKKYIDLIEFKGGIIDKFNPKYQPLNSTCSSCNELHKSYFDGLKRSHKWHKKVIHQNLQLKVVETLLLLMTYIFPKCQDAKIEKRIRLVCVMNETDVSPLDALEIQLNNIAKSKPEKNELTQLIGKYAKEDCDGNKLFLDDFSIYMDSEFNKIHAYN